CTVRICLPALEHPLGLSVLRQFAGSTDPAGRCGDRLWRDLCASAPGCGLAAQSGTRHPLRRGQTMTSASVSVLIIGAGPTGLVLALWLTKLGVKVRIIDKTAESGTTSRALAVQARTLELYRQLDLALDLADFVVERGHKVPAVNLWVKGEPAARLAFEAIGKDLTAYPFLEIFPQDEHERLLIERLEKFGVSVERQTELTHFREEGGRVIARLRGPDGHEEDCQAQY